MSDEKLTFRQLRDILNTFSTDQLDSDATVYLVNSDEYYEVNDVLYQDEDDALHTGHPMLVVPYA